MAEVLRIECGKFKCLGTISFADTYEYTRACMPIHSLNVISTLSNFQDDDHVLVILGSHLKL